MNAKEFFDMVALMRHAQKEYQKTGGNDALALVRKTESVIDKEILRVRAIINGLPVDGETYLKKEK